MDFALNKRQSFNTAHSKTNAEPLLSVYPRSHPLFVS